MASKDVEKKTSSKKSTAKSVVETKKSATTTPQKTSVRISSGKTGKKTGKKSSAKKSLTVDPSIYSNLKKIMASMTEKLGGRITFSMVIQSLLNDHYDLQNVKQELEEIKLEMDETQTYLKDMLKLALSNKQTTPQFIPIPVNSINPQIPGQTLPPPPPPSQSYPPSLYSLPSVPKKTLSNYTPPDTGNLKKDYVAEIKQIFTGTFLKPSEIAKVTKPKYINSDINEIDENAPIPDINKVSTAKRYPRRDETPVDV